VAAVAAVAVVDGIRRDDGQAPAVTAEDERRDDASVALAALGAHGELALYGESCGEQRLTLPSLTTTPAVADCGPPGVASPDGELVAHCSNDRIEVQPTETRGRQHLPGCAPAWRPDGTLTASFGDEVVTFRPCAAPQPCAETLIGRSQLERAARRHPRVPDRPARLRALVDGIAWLSTKRAAVSMSIRLGGRFEGLGPLGAIAFFERGRLETVPPYFRLTGGRLAASPRGSYVTQTPDVILRPDGTQLSLPQHLRGARDFAWSPDERLLALAMPFAVEVVDVASLERYDRTGGGLRSVTLPQSAARLTWR
jgi:hypothetical protein